MRKLTARIDARGKGTLAADGADLSAAVGSLYVTAHVGHPPTVMVTLPALELDLDLDDPRVHIPEPVAAALINLGWTPPPAGHATTGSEDGQSAEPGQAQA